MIYLDKLTTKLNAILAKDVVAITNNRVYIPFLGNTYNVSALENWLQKRIDVLVDVRDGNYTDQQIQTFIDYTYDKLSADGKLIADKILAGDVYSFNPSLESDYDNLVVLILYKFVTTP